jgi:hypothetical protein
MYTNDWTCALEKSLPVLFPEKIYTPMRCLEVGSYEGKGSCMIVDYLCNHSDSQLVCVDPWQDCYVQEKDMFTIWNSCFIGQYCRFLSNTKHLGSKIGSKRGKSDDILPSLEKESFDFIYIDGDHSKEGVYNDAINSFSLCKKGGIILFDDYQWSYNDNENVKCYTSEGVDNAIQYGIERLDMSIEILFKNSQCAIRM